MMALAIVLGLALAVAIVMIARGDRVVAQMRVERQKLLGDITRGAVEWRMERERALEAREYLEAARDIVQNQAVEIKKLYERMVALTVDRPLVEQPDGSFDDDKTQPPSVRQADMRAVVAARSGKRAVPGSEITSDMEQLEVSDLGAADADEDETDG